MKQSKLAFGKSSAKKSPKKVEEQKVKKTVDPLLFFSKKVEQKPGIVLKKSNYFDDAEIDSLLREKGDELEKSLEPMDVSDENNPVSGLKDVKKPFVSVDVPMDVPMEELKDIPMEELKDKPVDEPVEQPKNIPMDEPKKKFNYYAHKAKLSQMPKAHGSKEIPVGEENCLGGLAFVFTGELESLSRDEAVDLVKRYGGYYQVYLME